MILMNHFTSTRFASLALAIGFFLACSSSKPSIDSLVDNALYEDALAQIESELQANPDQPELLIQKGQIHLLMADQSIPQERDTEYMEAIKAFDSATEFDISDEKKSELENELQNIWGKEFNTGTEMVEAGNDLNTAKAHFSNAIILNENEPKAYISASVVEYNLGNIDEAISILTKAKNILDPVPEQIYENMGFLYLQNGDAKNSIFYYELANTDISKNKNIAFGLVNTYILNNQVERAADILGELNANFPNDPKIKNVYGTQLYTIASGIMDDLHAAYQNNDTTLVAQIKFEAEGVGEQAEEELISAYQLENTNQEYVKSLAVFYNNMLGKYLTVHAVAFPADKEAFNTKAEILLSFAIQYYDKLASFTPDNREVNGTLEVLKKLQSQYFSN